MSEVNRRAVPGRRIVQVLLARYGRTFAEELRIPLEQGGPSPLFRLLMSSILFSARIRHSIALEAARALFECGWTTPQKMTEASWVERARVLKRSGYARHDERTSRLLGDACTLMLERYRGDLRRLRELAGRDPNRERELLKEFNGLGEVGVDIFCREVQIVWDELLPFADRRALDTARQLGLGSDAEALRRLVASDRDFVRLVAALARTSLNRDEDEVLAEAAGFQAGERR